MFVDARRLPPDTAFSSDVCIVGSGPAGVLLAAELARGGLDVIILESGGIGSERELDKLGQPAPGYCFPNSNRIWTTRRFGGNANYWCIETGLCSTGVRLLPLSDADFERRDWISDSGWPISASDLAPYYTRAQVAFLLPPIGFDPSQWDAPFQEPLSFRSPKLRTAIFQFGDASIVTKRRRQEFRTAPNVRVLLHATALSLEVRPDTGKVIAIRAASAPEKRLAVSAQSFVLAVGGLAAPQLLMASNQVYRRGIGNEHDLVGRYFMDHPQLYGGDFIPRSTRLFDQMRFFDIRHVRDTAVMGHLQFSEAALRTEPLLNISALFFPRVIMSPRRQQGLEAAKRLAESVRKRIGAPSWYDLYFAISGADGIARTLINRAIAPNSNIQRGGWSRMKRKFARFTHFEVIHQAEQLPHYDNRIYLSGEKDPFGSFKINIQWQWHADDRAALARSIKEMAHELNATGAGEFRLAEPFHVNSTSSAHYMGTTRMSSTPQKGVVDEHCRVHGHSNVFVASASVFPTGGFANSTLTTVALALRIADRIKYEHGHTLSLASTHH